MANVVPRNPLAVCLIRFVITVGYASGVTGAIGQEPFVVNDPRPTGGTTYGRHDLRAARPTGGTTYNT